MCQLFLWICYVFLLGWLVNFLTHAKNADTMWNHLRRSAKSVRCCTKNGLFDRRIDVNVQLKVSLGMGRFMFTEFVDVIVYIVLCLTIVYVWMSMSRQSVQKPSRAVRCGVQEGEGVAEWTCKIDSWTRSERVPEVAGINRRAGASFDLSHGPPPCPHTPAHSWSLYCFCRMSPWLRQDAVNGQPPADNSQLHSLNIAFYFTHHDLSTLLCCV